MRPANIQRLRQRLTEMGIELAGRAEYMETTVSHDLSTPHRIIQLDRAAGSMPDYPVVGFVDCLVCREMLFVTEPAARLMMVHHALPCCRLCNPVDLGFTEVDPFENLREFGNRPPSPDFIRDLLRGM